MTTHLFVLEQYEPSDSPTGGDLRDLPAAAGVRLVLAIHLPADEVRLALIEGPDQDSALAAAESTGWRVDRINPATWIERP